MAAPLHSVMRRLDVEDRCPCALRACIHGFIYEGRRGKSTATEYVSYATDIELGRLYM